MKRIFAIILVTSLFGCSSSGVESLRAELSDVRSVQATQTASIEKLETQLRQLSGRIDEIEHKSLGKTAELERSLRSVSTRVPPPVGVPEDLLSVDEQRIAQNTGSAADLYRAGLQSVRTGDFRGAIGTMNSFVEQNPNTAFTDNGLFWIGISHDQLGEFDRSIAAYGDVYKKFPAEDMAPAALFYLGEAFLKLGNRGTAVDTFKTIVDEYGRSSFSAKARTKIQELSRGSGARR